jgi:hypothetical protein
MIKQKRGWIRIIEAFIAILLIASVLLIVINKGYVGRTDVSSKVYDSQVNVLREIELDQSLRSVILDVNAPLSGEDVPIQIREKIENRMPDNIACSSKICVLDELCSLEDYPEAENVYAQSVAITANLSEFDPKQLKLFCWIE